MTKDRDPGHSRPSGRPRRQGGPSGRDAGGRDGQRRGNREGAHSGGRGPAKRSTSDRQRPPRTPRLEPKAEETKAYPEIDSDVEPRMLDRIARRELVALDKDVAEFIANHLVMAARHIDDDPSRAHQHALAALDKGSRVPVVRETLGITAYLTGDFGLALRELRTHRRLTGSLENIPMMVDCERGLGRPERGLELARSISRDSLSPRVRVELAIALSGARLDRGETDRALLELEIPELTPQRVFDYSPDLFDAYAVVLAELGRDDEASIWGRRANQAAIALQEHALGDEMVVADAVVEEDE